MTASILSLPRRLLASARAAWMRRQPQAIKERFRRRDKEADKIIGTLFHMIMMCVVVAAVAYVSAAIFIGIGDPLSWLIWTISMLYVNVCRSSGQCSIPYLHAGLVVGIDMVVLVSIYVWDSIDSIGGDDDFSELHDHLDLITEQIRDDYTSVDKLNERLNAVELRVIEADQRIDMVVEYTPPDKTTEVEAEESPL